MTFDGLSNLSSGDSYVYYKIFCRDESQSNQIKIMGKIFAIVKKIKKGIKGLRNIRISTTVF